MPAAKDRPPAKRRPGRPSKLTDERVQRLLTAIQAGNYIETAAEVAGIGKSTFYRWMNADEPEFREFREAVKKAEAEAEARDVGMVRVAARSTWQAAAWWLERKFPERWGRRDRHEVEHSGRVGLTLERLHELAEGEEVEQGG